jgi:hypothetical protein
MAVNIPGILNEIIPLINPRIINRIQEISIVLEILVLSSSSRT